MAGGPRGEASRRARLASFRAARSLLPARRARRRKIHARFLEHRQVHVRPGHRHFGVKAIDPVGLAGAVPGQNGAIGGFPGIGIHKRRQVDVIGVEAAEIGLVLKSVPDDQLDDEVEALADRMASVPINQLAMQKMVINAAVEEKINQTQRLATVFDGITRHSPEGMNFKARVEAVGWKQAVEERDEGTFNWTENTEWSR